MNIHQPYSENELLQRIAEGDEKAFADLLRNIVPYLEGMLLKVVKQEHAVKEIMQETFVRIWLNREKLPSLEKPMPWIKRVALNEAFTWLNKNATRAKILNDLPADAGMPDTVFEQLMLKETQAILQQAISELPPQRKRIYLMSRGQGMKPAQIARELQLSEGYVKNVLTAALDFLRQRLLRAGRFFFSIFF